jgi:hypothetical protein
MNIERSDPQLSLISFVPVFNFVPFAQPIYNAIFKRLTAEDQDQVCYPFLVSMHKNYLHK